MSNFAPDVELLRQLDAAGDESVGVVCSLQVGSTSDKPLTGDETTEQVTRVLQRVERLSGLKPDKFKIFRNLGSFSLYAPAAFVRRLLEQDEIATATANIQREDMLIRPVSRKPPRA